jgi:protein-tyrosine phosphatase
MKILFVCSGNTCRSPLALAAWRALQNQGRAPKDVEAQSAGLTAGEGSPAAKHSIPIARAWGGDLSTHASQPLTAEMAKAAAAIFVMSPEHLYSLREYFDIDPEKIHLLGAYGDARECEIFDPFGGSHEAYETCAARIFQSVEAVADAIQRGEIGGQNCGHD